MIAAHLKRSRIELEILKQERALGLNPGEKVATTDWLIEKLDSLLAMNGTPENSWHPATDFDQMGRDKNSGVC